MTALIDMATLAADLDVNYDTLRKNWRAWVRKRGFPAPVETRPYKWNPVSIEAYKARREAQNRADVLTPPPHGRQDEPRGPSRPAAAIARQRAAVAALMSGNAPQLAT